MTLTTLEKRNGYRLQTGWGHVRVAPFSDDIFVSAKDVLLVLEKNPALSAEELLTRIQRNEESRASRGDS